MGLAGLLLAGDGTLRTLAGTGVGLRTLSAYGQALAVAQAFVAADFNLAADVSGHFAAKVTLNLVVAFNVVTQLDQLGVASGP